MHTPDALFHTEAGDDTAQALLAVLDTALQAVQMHIRARARDLRPVLDPNRLPVRVMHLTATLVAERCEELRALLDIYAQATDELTDPDDNPF